MSKIAFLLSQSLDSPSGLGRYGPLARELTKFGHIVDIYALHPAINDLENRSIEINGVRVHYVAPMHVKKDGDIKSYYSSPQLIKITLDATWHLCRAAIRSSADIIHICKPHPMNSIAGLMARLIHHSDLYLDCDDYEAGSGRFSTRWQKAIITWFEKWMPHRVNLVTTNTMFMHEKLISWGIPADDIVYLPNGVDRPRFTPPNPQQLDSLRNKLDLTGKKVIVYIGSLSSPSHPVNLLLEAFHQLQELEPNSSLILVGGGEDLTRLKNLANKLSISHATRFCGKVPPDSVSLYYSLADVSVDPVYDNDAARGRSPLKLFESWACGVPIVSGDVGDRRYLLGDPPAGLLSQPGDPSALSQAMHSIIKDPGLADELRIRGLERVKSFTWDQLAIILNQIYLERSAN